MQVPLKPISGTMRLHAVMICNGHTSAAETSCYCPGRLVGSEESHCESWTIARRGKPNHEQESQSMQTDRQESNHNMQNLTEAQFQIEDLNQGNFVAALYEQKWYIGKVRDTDLDDSTIHITFTKETKTK